VHSKSGRQQFFAEPDTVPGRRIQQPQYEAQKRDENVVQQRRGRAAGPQPHSNQNCSDDSVQEDGYQMKNKRFVQRFVQEQKLRNEREQPEPSCSSNRRLNCVLNHQNLAQEEIRERELKDRAHIDSCVAGRLEYLSLNAAMAEEQQSLEEQYPHGIPKAKLRAIKSPGEQAFHSQLQKTRSCEAPSGRMVGSGFSDQERKALARDALNHNLEVIKAREDESRMHCRPQTSGQINPFLCG